MIRSLWTAATGMQGQSTNIDVIANNSLEYYRLMIKVSISLLSFLLR